MVRTFKELIRHGHWDFLNLENSFILNSLFFRSDFQLMTADLNKEARMLDVHTHNPLRYPDIIEIEAPDLRRIASNKWQPSGPFILGLHPWYIDQVVDPKTAISKWINHPDCIGVGETGLDLASKVDLDIQESWFRFHFDIANKYKKGLIVLHMVRCWDRLRKILQTVEYSGVLLIHDCQASTNDLVWLEQDRRMWFSYGSALKRPNSKGYKGFLSVNEERLLFETDDSGESLKDVISRARALRSLVNHEEIEQEFLRKILLN